MLVSPLSGHSALPSRHCGDRSSACSAVGVCLVPEFNQISSELDLVRSACFDTHQNSVTQWQLVWVAAICSKLPVTWGMRQHLRAVLVVKASTWQRSVNATKLWPGSQQEGRR